MCVLDKLIISSPEERIQLISKCYEKNRVFFRKQYPEIDSLIESLSCPYEFNITADFLEIVDVESGGLAHPNDFIGFISALSKEEHGAWQNLINFQPVEIKNSPIHKSIVKKFSNVISQDVHHVTERLSDDKVSIGNYQKDLKVLPPVVFIGLFYALHIDKIVAQNEIPKILLIEPDQHRFEVSCYFLDYEKIYEKYGELNLSVGPVVTQDILDHFHSAVAISSNLWIRILQGYDDDRAESIKQQIRLQQNVLDGITTSFDRELEAYGQGRKNILAGLPFLSKKNSNKLNKANIVIAASGPSLKDSYQWLKSNREKLVILAVHSAVLPLKKAGIVPDFQVSIESHIDNKLYLDEEIPFLSNYKVQPDKIKHFRTPLLLIEKHLPNPFRFSYYLDGIGPSTTTLATLFALDCRPEKIFLVGVDVGFKDPEKKFVEGGIHQQNQRMKSDFGQLYKVESNFSETPFCYTNEFFHKVKREIEKQINNTNDEIEVYNMSDGAKISGAAPLRFKDCQLNECFKKSESVSGIIDRFVKPELGVNYFSYDNGIESLLEDFKKDILSSLSVESFDFVTLNRHIDNVIAYAVRKNENKDGVLRLVLAERLLVDILSSWFRYFLVCNNEEELKAIYSSGLKGLSVIFDEIKNEVKKLYIV